MQASHHSCVLLNAFQQNLYIPPPSIYITFFKVNFTRSFSLFHVLKFVKDQAFMNFKLQVLYFFQKKNQKQKPKHYIVINSFCSKTLGFWLLKGELL